MSQALTHSIDASWMKLRPIAHRGLHDGNRQRFENTLSAFDAAIERNYAIECDVVLSADGIPVVFHDLTLERLTNQTGDVIAHTSGQLGQLQIGGTADRIPTLAETLKRVAGRVPIVIELKGHDASDHRLVKAVADALRGYDGAAAIMSFDHWLVRRFKIDAPGIACGLTAEGMKVADMEAHFSMLAHSIDFVSYCVEHLPNRFISHVRERLHMPVITWTVRNQDQVDKTQVHADQITFEGFLP
jgi:glycerophosphoryl diester phosphodiesterase